MPFLNKKPKLDIATALTQERTAVKQILANKKRYGKDPLGTK